MTHKAKLFGSVVIAAFIAVMIPVAIFATQNKTVSIQNHVKFFVEDLEGQFFYAITGNKLDKNSTTSSLDVGYNPVSNTITPQLVFKAEYAPSDQPGQDDYLVYNGIGGVVESNTIQIGENNGIEFDETHTTINYYFVFINEAVYSDLTPRSVFVTAKAEHTIPPTIASTYWSYIIKPASSASALSPLNTTGTWTTSIDDPQIFDTGIEVEPKDRALCSYIILKYTLTVHTNIEFTNNLALTVTLKSAQS